MLVIPTCQQADVDLVQMGEKVDVEKDRLLERVRNETSVVQSSCFGRRFCNTS